MGGVKPKVAIGVRSKTGWAMVVAVTDSAHPRALLRERIELLADAERFVYHRAEELGTLAAATKLIERERKSVVERAQRAIEKVRSRIASTDDTVALGVVAPPEKPAPALEAVLKTHMKIHAAEGVFYPACWIAAGSALGWPVSRIAEKEMILAVADRCDTDEAEVTEILKSMGAPLGRPWDADCRLAAAAAWVALNR